MHIIAVYADTEAGIEAVITTHAKGFAVAVRDTDAGEYLPTVTIVTDEAAAHTKAKAIAGITA